MRLRQHLNYVDRNVEATGRHFNLPGHDKSNLSITIVEKIHNRDVWVREEIESMHIRKANTYYKEVLLVSKTGSFSQDNSTVNWFFLLPEKST